MYNVTNTLGLPKLCYDQNVANTLTLITFVLD